MLNRRTNEQCKVNAEEGKCFCNRYHSIYEKYLAEGYTVEEMIRWDCCTKCEQRFLKREPYWKVCETCQEKTGKYCGWYARGLPIRRCPWRCKSGNICCARHMDLGYNEYVGKEPQHCAGCKSVKPVEEFDGFKSCRKCRDRTAVARNEIRSKINKLDLSTDHKCCLCDNYVSGAFNAKNCISCSIKKRISDAQKFCKTRNWCYILSTTLASELMQKQCLYCDTKPDIINGIDRIDSNQTYSSNNTVPCCKYCNLMKNDSSVYEFIDRCEAINKYQISDTVASAQLFPPKQNPAKFSVYNRSAQDRNIAFDLSQTEFNKLTSGRCHYCGNSDNVGIDRLDSNKSYNITNCVSCCKICNRMKLNLECSVFLRQVKAIAERRDTILSAIIDVKRHEKERITIKPIAMRA